MLIIAFISIILIVLLALQENTVSDLTFNNEQIQKLYGYSEPEGGVTYIEALGLEYISFGSIFNFSLACLAIYKLFPFSATNLYSFSQFLLFFSKKLCFLPFLILNDLSRNSRRK